MFLLNSLWQGWPKVTTLPINTWAMHYSTEMWSTDVAEFKPDPWMVNEDVSVTEKYFVPVSPWDKDGAAVKK